MGKFYLSLLMVLLALSFSPLVSATVNVTNVTATVLSTTAENIFFNTNETGTTVVRYGTVSGSYPNTLSNTSVNVTSHYVNITGLMAGNYYYYIVNSTSNVSGTSAQSTESQFRVSCSASGVAFACDSFDALPSLGAAAGGFFTNTATGIITFLLAFAVLTFLVIIFGVISKGVGSRLGHKDK